MHMLWIEVNERALARGNERQEAKTEASKLLAYTGLGGDGDTLFVYYEEIKREIHRILI
jgi:hypothetical protein